MHLKLLILIFLFLSHSELSAHRFDCQQIVIEASLNSYMTGNSISEIRQALYRYHALRNRAELEKLKAVSASATLTMKTINLGLMFKFKGIFKVPFYAERSANLKLILADLMIDRPVVMYLQETWHGVDRKAISEYADESGYLIADSNNDESRHGLQILVRKDAVDLSVRAVTQFLPIARSNGNIWDLDFSRGVLAFTVPLVIGNRSIITTFTTTHWTAGLENSLLRNKQAIDTQKILSKLASESEFISIGGDLNASMDQGVFENVPENKINAWRASGRAQARLLGTAYLIDTHTAVGDVNNPLFTQNPATNPMTADSPTTKSEPAQRLDVLMIGSTKDNIAAATTHTGLFGTNPILGNPRMRPSDHMGVSSSIVLGIK